MRGVRASLGTVLLVHGLAGTGYHLGLIGRRLRREGFGTHYVTYASTKMAIEEAAERHLIPAVESIRTAGNPIHFVTHSMGALVLRQAASQLELNPDSRAVLIAPPNAGSKFIERNRKRAWMRLLGPAAQQMGTSPDDLPSQVPLLPCQVGVIASSRDWRVRTEETVHEAEDERLVVNAGHTTVLWNRLALDATTRFLLHGTFSAGIE